MGTSVRFFALEPDGSFRRLPAGRFEKFLQRDKSATFPEYANTAIRSALVFIETRDRRATEVRSVEFNVAHVDASGRRDEAKFMEMMKLIPAIMQPHWGSDDATGPKGADRFANKRMNDEFRWTPTEEQLLALRATIWKS